MPKMTRPIRRLLSGSQSLALLIGAAQCLLAPAGVFAAEPMAVKSEQPLRDPWVPPESRKPSTATPAEGAALRAQVERKLKKAFDAADVSHSGSLTRQQANAAGLGFVARHFDQIDRQKVGAVRFEDVKRYLIERGAQLD
jgi:hypothetical protein